MAGKEYLQSTSRALLYAYLYVFLEWLFLVTKPSFLGAWSFLDRVTALLIGSLPFVGAVLAVHLTLCLGALGVSQFQRLSTAASRLLRITPALVAAGIVLMLVDNFTYTVFGWGIVSTTVYTAPAYWLLSLLIFALHIRRRPHRLAFKPHIAAALVLLSGAALAWSFHGVSRFIDADYSSARGGGSRLPNIIMFAADGVNANHMSAFGYHRETTPNLDKYLDRALIADNTFTNSGWTTGSLTSMLTGKNPATTKVLYPPYTLQGTDAYANLPRILRKLGYTNLQESLRYYADGADLNWAGSFDFANGRPLDWPPANGKSLALQQPWLLSSRIYQRLSTRVEQLLFIEQMENEHAAVTSNEHAKVYGISDDVRMGRVFEFIRDTPEPFFVHIHLMGTHCCPYHPRQKQFSAQEFDDEGTANMAAFDDTILDSDRHFGALMTLLEEEDLLDNTLVIYSSDHTAGWDFRSQVPLIFLFPNGAHKGRHSATAQLLDVAPTILTYLKVEVPDWMEGRSLLEGRPDRHRPIFSSYRLDKTHFNTDKNDRLARVAKMGPPTYGLNEVGMVVCQRWYVMRLDDGTISSGEINSHHDKCSPENLPTAAEAREMMSRFLRDRGFSF